MSQGKKQEHRISLVNKKAYFSYTITDTYVAGIVLQGTEIKSIRLGKANLQDAYCYFHDNELWVKGLHISPYMAGSYHNHLPDVARKLLLHKYELEKLQKKKQEKGYTIAVLELFSTPKNLIKLRIGLAKGKKLHDKREALRQKDELRVTNERRARP